MRTAKPQSGFTLVEAALAIALVGMALTATLQILQASKLSAAHTRDQKTARVLALKTLGEIATGLYWDELDQGAMLSGSYAEEDYPAFHWELAIGDQSFSDTEPSDADAPFDNWAWRREQEMEASLGQGDEFEQEDQHEPFEKIRIRVIYPKYANLTNELKLEYWLPWDQVYRPLEDDESAGSPSGGPGGSDAGGNSGNSGNSAGGSKSIDGTVR